MKAFEDYFNKRQGIVNVESKEKERDRKIYDNRYSEKGNIENKEENRENRESREKMEKGNEKNLKLLKEHATLMFGKKKEQSKKKSESQEVNDHKGDKGVKKAKEESKIEIKKTYTTPFVPKTHYKIDKSLKFTENKNKAKQESHDKDQIKERSSSSINLINVKASVYEEKPKLRNNSRVKKQEPNFVRQNLQKHYKEKVIK